MSQFGDIPNVVIDTAIGELPDQRKAATIRRWLVQVHEKAADRERQAADKERLASEALREVESERSRLEEKEKDLESGRAALGQEHARIARVVETLPSELSKTVKNASAALNETLGSTSEAVKALKDTVKEARDKASGVGDLVSALPSKSTLEEWANSQDEGRLRNMKTFISQSMEKLKAQNSIEHSAELEQLRGKYDTQSQEVSRLEGEKTTLNEEVQSLREKDRQSSAVITGLHVDCKAKDQVMATLEGMKESLQQDLEVLRSSDSDRASELEQLQSRYEEMEQEVTRIREEKANLGVEVEGLRSRDRENSFTLGGLRADCNGKDQAVAALQAEKERLGQEVQGLRKSHDESVRTGASLQAQYSAREREVSTLKKENQDLVRDVESLRTENTGLLQEVTRLRTQRDSLEEKALRFDALSAEHQTTRNLLQDADVEIGVLRDRIKRREEECMRRSKYGEDVRRENEAGRVAAAANERHIQELNSRLQLADAERQELIEARPRLQGLQNQLDGVSGLLQQATEARRKSEQDCDALKQGIVKATQDMSSWHDRYTSLSETHAKTEEALSEQLDAAHRELGQERSENEELQTKLASAAQESRAKDIVLENIQAQLTTFQSELVDERRRADKVGSLGESVKSILERIESTQRLQQELSDAKSLLKEAKEKLTTQQATGQGFASELAKMYSILAETFKDLPTAPGGNDAKANALHDNTDVDLAQAPRSSKRITLPIQRRGKMSLRNVRDASGVNPFDEKSRREWTKAYLIADGHYDKPSLEKRYKASVEGIAKKLHAQQIDQVGEVWFEFFCDEAVWMKTYHNMDKFGLAPEWPFKEKPSRHDMSLGPSVNYRRWRVENGLSVPEEAPKPAPTEERITVVSPAEQDEVESPVTRGIVLPPPQQAIPMRPAPVRQVADAQGQGSAARQSSIAAIKKMSGLADSMFAHNAAADASRAQVAKEKKEKKEMAAAVAKAEVIAKKVGVAQERHAAEITKIKATKVTDWSVEEDEESDLSPIIPLDEPVAVLPDFGANTEMPWVAEFPSAASRKAIWEDLYSMYGKRPFTGAVSGHFEVTLPPWLDFHRLVLGEDKVVYNEIRRLISPMLTIAWPIVNGKPVALVVGVDPRFETLSTSPYVRLEVRRLWRWVCHWVLLANKGDSMTLADHFALVNAQEKAGAPMDEDTWDQLTVAHVESMGNVRTAEYHARVQHEAEEQLVPELHAILQQPPRVAREYLGVWVRRDKPNTGMRLKFAFKYWVRVAIKSGKGTEEVFAWHNALSKELEEEKTQQGSD
ncbi:hypothetical protein ACKAV7_009912 [Fusarium commune]